MASRIRKATAEEMVAYAIAGHVYPLYGFVRVGAVECAVEDLRGSWSAPDPIYEIMAPAGSHFDDEGHSLLCVNLADVAERARFVDLVPCVEACG